MSNLEDLRGRALELKSKGFTYQGQMGAYGTVCASDHEKALCDLLVELIEALAVHVHGIGNTSRTSRLREVP